MPSITPRDPTALAGATRTPPSRMASPSIFSQMVARQDAQKLCLTVIQLKVVFKKPCFKPFERHDEAVHSGLRISDDSRVIDRL